MKTTLLAAITCLAAGLLAGPALSFPALNLTPSTPDIASSFITVN